MKLSKRTKSLLALSSSVILTLPVLTLTGCSNISQYCIPVTTANNPFTVAIKDPYRESGNGIYSTPKTAGSTTASDFAIGNDTMQMPKEFIYTSAYDSNFTQSTTGLYGYSNYNTPEWKEKGPEGTSGLGEKYQFNRKCDEDMAWHNMSSSQLSYMAGNGTLSSYQNLNISSTISTVNTTSASFVNLFNYMNTYLERIISQRSEDTIQEYLNFIFSGKKDSGFTYGNKSNFYEYFLDNANLLSTAGSQFKFGPYMADWSFNDTGIVADNVFHTWNTSGLGETKSPFISTYMQNLTTADYDAALNGKVPANKNSPYKFPINKDFTGWYTSNSDKQEYTYHEPINSSTLCNPYIKYSYKEQNGQNAKKINDFAGIMNVPMLISPKSITSAYYNPSNNNSSIQPIDWLTRDGDINTINNKLSQEGSWSAIKANVNLPDLKVNSLSHKQEPQKRTSAPTGTPYDSWKCEGFPTTNIDPRVQEWITGNKIKFGDWVALANYGVLTINFKYEYKDNETATEIKHMYIKALLPFFSGFSAIFPAYMLFTNKDCYKEINPDAPNDNPEKKYYIQYSGSGIETDFKNMISSLTSNNLPDTTKTYSSAYEMLKNDPYMIFKWTFGNIDAANYSTFHSNLGQVDYSTILDNAN